MSDAPHSHSHSHHNDGHEHEHNDGHDFAAANAKHFNENVDKFEDQPFAKEFAGRQFIAYLGAYPFDGEKTVMMDFACGIGMVSRQMAPYAKQIVGVDISQGLVDEFNLRVKNQGLTPDELKAVCVQLKGEEGELDNLKFDVIVCGMAYHHISDVAKTTQTLAFFLKPGGVLMVNDGLKMDVIPPMLMEMQKKANFKDVVPHTHGFEESEIRKIFEDAGLVKFQLDIMSKAKHHTFPGKVFIAKGVKPKA
ncbi:hypothetical protein PC9H_001568 [Pleurotus ostreatus]|uniref:S-adenosyl-L-methionine-dependent methyltransferase n=1 Tax=Pleurotus ostreatus TaxID=5322 RepID=A0A8H7A5L5_PLEOS|nr:uncharacterized protein PC9H_001568 [Pleurotus ostreatus]KAF7441219.1 hypothetical protein PC9H_001568 [Pleurotus ostreatus]KAJ8699269.1 hypothetical protein PTI98_002401 [Pleurotus ostreatus]